MNKPVGVMRIGPWRRFAAGLAGAGYLLLVYLLHGVPADPRGYGTHERLGFVRCRSMEWFNFPCPLCGCTTAFILMAHGQPLDALVCQPAGAAAFVVMVAGALVLGGAAATGRLVYPASGWTRRLVCIGAAFAAWAWLYKIILCRMIS